MGWNPKNATTEPLRIRHTELTRSGDSEYRSICPACKTGHLLVSRNQETLRLRPIDRCTFCAQLVIYEDVVIGGESVEPFSESLLKFMKKAGPMIKKLASEQGN